MLSLIVLPVYLATLSTVTAGMVGVLPYNKTHIKLDLKQAVNRSSRITEIEIRNRVSFTYDNT